MRTLLLTLFALIWSCGESPNSSSGEEPLGCQEEEECPQGLRCVEGACLGAGVPEWSFDLRLLPPTDQPLSSADILGFHFEGEPELRLDALALWPWVSRRGRVSHQGRTVNARVTARAERGLESAPLLFQSGTMEEDRFYISLAEWWPTPRNDRRAPSYAVLLEPESLPPYRLIGWTVPAGENILFELPSLGELPELKGVLRLSPEKPIPQRGLSIALFEPGGRRISTEATTDGEGHFQLKFWPLEQELEALLRVRSQDPEHPLPELEQPLSLKPQVNLPQVEIYLGNFGSLFELRGRVGAEGEEIEGALLSFRGAIGDGYFCANAHTGEGGRFQVKLYEGEYLIDLEPPPPARLTRRRVEISKGEELLLIPSTQTPLFAQVLGPDGEPIAEARVQSELIHAAYSDPQLESEEPPPPRRVEVQSDAEGGFALRLDPGTHRLSVSPPQQSGLPSAQRELSVPLIGSLENVKLEIPPGALLLIPIRSPEGEGVSGVAAEVWRGPQRIAQGLSDEAGVLRLILPNEDL